MSELQGAFTPNSEDIAAKVIDDELIVIRLSDGTYYSMDNVGTRVWELIEAGHNLAAVAGRIASDYAMPAARVEADVLALVRELVTEQLIIPAPSAPVAPPPVEARTPAREYQAPRINVYRDMGNLLALDPPTPGIDDLLFDKPNDE